MLPFQPESTDSLRNRFPAAIARVWDAVAVADAALAGQHPEHPGGCRENVFDTSNGIRLIVSLDKDEDSKYLHVSISINSDHSDFWRRKLHSVSDFYALAISTLRQISGITLLGPCESFISEGGVPHLMINPSVLDAPLSKG